MNCSNVADMNLPDLASLESVETRDRSMLIMVLGMSSMFIPVLFIMFQCLAGYRQYMDSRGLILGCVVLTLVTYVAIRILSGYTYFRTDPSGLTLRGPIRRRFISWTDIKAARYSESRVRDSALILITGRGRIKLWLGSSGGSKLSTNVVVASVWQHLRRMGRADMIELSDAMRSLWEEIGDDVPQEMDGGSRSASGGRIGAVICIVMFAAFAVFPPFAFGLNIRGAAMTAMITPSCIVLLSHFLLPEVLRKAQRVSVRKDCLDLEFAFAKASIPWLDITYAAWTRDSLSIWASGRKHDVRITYLAGKRDSERLILAIIRRLRTAGVPQAVPIPNMISANPGQLAKPAYSSMQSAAMKQAYLNTLDADVAKRLRRLQLLDIIPVFGGIGLMFWLMVTNALGELSRTMHMGAAPDTRYFVQIDSACLAIPIMLSTILLISLATEALARLIAGPYLDAWRAFRKVGSFNIPDKVAIPFFISFIAVCILLVPLYIGCYTRVTDAGVAINRFWGMGEEFHSWNQVKTVEVVISTHVSHGKMSENRNYKIEFTDGTDWTFDGSFRRISDVLDQAMPFIADKSGKNIQYVYK